MRINHALVVAGLTALLSNIVLAETVSIAIKNGNQDIQANADYRIGQPGKPAVLIVHGFLQTHNYLTLQNIKDALSENGYTILAPSLSLGVSNRKASLACEAVHTHTMKNDIAEVVQWLAWLKQRRHKEVVLVGHSFGSVTLLAHLEATKKQNRTLPVNKFIAVSLTNSSEDIPKKSAMDLARKEARARAAAGDTGLQAYNLAYCKKYMSPAAAFLSYADWTSERTLNALKNIRPGVNVIAILGGKDKRMPVSWPKQLSHAGISVKVIAGANHFFGGEHEFDLQDTLIKVVKD